VIDLASTRQRQLLMASIRNQYTNDILNSGQLRTRAHLESLFPASMHALDLLGIGLLVCNSAGDSLFGNQTAEQMFRSADVLERRSEALLTSVSGDSPLAETVRRSVKDLISHGEAGTHAAVSIAHGSHERCLTVVVRSIENLSAPPDPAALVLIVDAGLPLTVSELDLQQLYGLTSTEARLAILLAEGKTLDESCAEMGVRRSTGCTHLKRIFKKTGVRRQGELVALLMRSIGLARLGRAVELAAPGPRPSKPRLRNGPSLPSRTAGAS